MLADKFKPERFLAAEIMAQYSFRNAESAADLVHVSGFGAWDSSRPFASASRITVD